MSDTPDTAESAAWHRQFAMACNNRAWQLTVQPRSIADDHEMLDAAHAASYHWSRIGTEVNRMRATMLLAEVHACLKLGSSALQYGQEMHTFFVNQPDTPDWELAFAHAIYAHCAAVGGQTEMHAVAYRQAERAISEITDDDDRKIVNQTFAHVPAP